MDREGYQREPGCGPTTGLNVADRTKASGKEFPSQFKKRQVDLYTLQSKPGEAFTLVSSFPFTTEMKVFSCLGVKGCQELLLTYCS